MVVSLLFGFDLEGRLFSLEYAKKRFEYLHKKVDLLEVPVYKFIRYREIDTQLLREFIDLASSYDFKFTAHAEDSIELMPAFTPDEYYVKKIQLNLDVAEKIDAIKIVFHQRGMNGVLPKMSSSLDICLENTPELDPFKAEELARENDLHFTLDVPHMFLHYVHTNKDVRNCYEDLSRLRPDHLHISNTYFEHGSVLSSIFHLLRGDISSAFVKLVGDFHLPLHTGHINYKKVFRKLRLPNTVIMEISTPNYELLMRSGRRHRSKIDVIKRGYEEDIRYFKKLVKRISS